MRYAETDQMGVVYYANYLIWMEVGRVELCRACGFHYRDMEREDGVLLAVAEANCRYLSPARYDDEVIVRTWIEARQPPHGDFRLRDAPGRRRPQTSHRPHETPVSLSRLPAGETARKISRHVRNWLRPYATARSFRCGAYFRSEPLICVCSQSFRNCSSWTVMPPARY